VCFQEKEFGKGQLYTTNHLAYASWW